MSDKLHPAAQLLTLKEPNVQMLKKLCEMLRKEWAPDQQPVIVPLSLLEELLKNV